MGVCSYCHKYKHQDEECFGWEEAKTHCGVVEPERPKAKPMTDIPEDIMREAMAVFPEVRDLVGADHDMDARRRRPCPSRSREARGGTGEGTRGGEGG